MHNMRLLDSFLAHAVEAPKAQAAATTAGRLRQVGAQQGVRGAPDPRYMPLVVRLTARARSVGGIQCASTVCTAGMRKPCVMVNNNNLI